MHFISAIFFLLRFNTSKWERNNQRRGKLVPLETDCSKRYDRVDNASLPQFNRKRDEMVRLEKERSGIGKVVNFMITTKT